MRTEMSYSENYTPTQGSMVRTEELMEGCGNQDSRTIAHLIEENRALKWKFEKLNGSLAEHLKLLKWFEEGAVKSANHLSTDPMMKVYYEGQAKTFAMVRKWLEEDVS